MSFDLAAALRRIKPSKFTAPLARRPDSALPFLDATPLPGPELLLDTTVYIDGLQDRSPVAIDRLLALRVCNHSSVCVAEMTHAFGRLNPAHRGTATALRQIGAMITALKPYRVRAPSASAWGAAGILAGLAFRLGGYARGQERGLLNDALVYVQAMENGQMVLTGNVADFDILNQVLPDGRMLFYRRI